MSVYSDASEFLPKGYHTEGVTGHEYVNEEEIARSKSALKKKKIKAKLNKKAKAREAGMSVQQYEKMISKKNKAYRRRNAQEIKRKNKLRSNSSEGKRAKRITKDRKNHY